MIRSAYDGAVFFVRCVLPGSGMGCRGTGGAVSHRLSGLGRSATTSLPRALGYLPATGLPAVVLQDTADRLVRVLLCDDIECQATSTVATVAGAAPPPRFNFNVAIDPSTGRMAFAVPSTDGALELLRCGLPTGCSAVDRSRIVGYEPAAAVTAAAVKFPLLESGNIGPPVMAWSTGGAEVMITQCPDQSCTELGLVTVLRHPESSTGAAVAAGTGPSIAVDPTSGLWMVGWAVDDYLILTVCPDFGCTDPTYHAISDNSRTTAPTSLDYLGFSRAGWP